MNVLEDTLTQKIKLFYRLNQVKNKSLRLQFQVTTFYSVDPAALIYIYFLACRLIWRVFFYEKRYNLCIVLIERETVWDSNLYINLFIHPHSISVPHLLCFCSAVVWLLRRCIIIMCQISGYVLICDDHKSCLSLCVCFFLGLVQTIMAV